MVVINRYVVYGQGGVFHVKDLIENRLASSTMDLGGRNNLFRTKSEAQSICDDLNATAYEVIRRKKVADYLQKVINAITALRNAHRELNGLWNEEPQGVDLNETEVGGKSFPFNESFDDLRIEAWHKLALVDLFKYRDQLQELSSAKV